MTHDGAVAFVRRHGIVTESARGPVPSLAEAIAGSPIQGSWWSHARADDIFRLSRALRGRRDVLTCRLVDGKVTFVHRRLWSALVRLASAFPVSALADVRELHASSGRHAVRETPFPQWVPTQVKREARRLDAAAARRALAAVLDSPVRPTRRVAPMTVRRRGDTHDDRP